MNGVIQGVIAGVLLALATWSWHNRRILVVVLWVARNPKVAIRLSYASVLKLEESGNFWLIPTRRTPVRLGPVGGVRKAIKTKEGVLTSRGFKFENVAGDPGAVAGSDIRGTLISRDLIAIWNAARDPENVESGLDALRREMREELGAGLDRQISALRFKKERTAIEGPKQYGAGQPPILRIVDVFRVVSPAGSDEIREVMQTVKRIGTLASSHELLYGETRMPERVQITSPSVFLIGSKSRNDPDR